jgi:hypothetical protein
MTIISDDGLKRDKPREKEVPFGALWKVVYQTSGPIPWKKEYHNYSYLNSKSLVKRWPMFDENVVFQ